MARGILARFAAAQPSPGSCNSQGSDQKHRQSCCVLRTGSSARQPQKSAREQQAMNSGLLVLSILLFVAGITLVTLG